MTRSVLLGRDNSDRIGWINLPELLNVLIIDAMFALSMVLWRREFYLERLASAPSKIEKLWYGPLINPPQSLSTLTYNYNSMLSYIRVSFFFQKKGSG